MQTEIIKDFHIAVGEAVDGGLVLAYLVEDNLFEGDITLTLQEDGTLLTADNTSHLLSGLTDEIITTLKAHKQFKVINISKDIVFDVTVNI